MVLYEQTNTITVLMRALVEADLSAPCYSDAIRSLRSRIVPDAQQLQAQLEVVESRLLPRMDQLQDALQLPLEICNFSDLIAEIYARDDVVDLNHAIQLARCCY